MGKRSDKERIPHDFYATTDLKALAPEFTKNIRGKSYAEPCYGEGDLENLLRDFALCEWRSDIRTTTSGCYTLDASCLSKESIDRCDLIITNPPYTRNVLLPMIEKFISLKPTWLLLPADYMHNVYFGDYMSRCSKVVSIGRLKWFKDSPHTSTDNYAWYYWKYKADTETETVFYGR